jgi:putative transposase
MKYQFIAEHRHEYPVSIMCRVLVVAVSGFYAWLRRAPGRRSQQNTRLGERIVRIYQANRQVYGSRRIHAALRAEGQSCGKKRVARLMRELGLSARPRKHRTRTTDSQHDQPVVPNLLNREFTATEPTSKWVADITAIWTSEGWLYLAVVLDIFSRMVVGWAMDSHRDEALVEQAARMALARRQPEPGLLHHSDRGSQYTATDYRELLAQYGIVVSMSGKGDCNDNALMESFFGTLKTECVDRQSFASRAQARQVIFEYLEAFYNRQRLHSSLGYVSPATYKQQAN